MPRSFTRKLIEVQIILAEGSFGQGNTKTIQGLPTRVSILKPGLPEKNSAKVSVSGLGYHDYEQLTRLAPQALESQKNLIRVRAGEEGETLREVFSGEISAAHADFNAAPDVALELEAVSGFYPQRIAAPPASVNGEAPVADLMQQWAGEAGYAFVNSGVSASVRNAVFNGSPLDKIEAAARQVGAECLIDDGTVLLLPAGGCRQGPVPLVSGDTGLIGYPRFTQDGIAARCLYRPDIRHGGLVKIESVVPRATNTWKVTRLEHTLSAFTPSGGPWETSFEGHFVE